MTTDNEPGAGGHVHRFNAVRVPPLFGHSYRRCAYCGLAAHLENHDASTCELCLASRAPLAAVEGDCKWCAEGNVPKFLDNDGVNCTISHDVGTLCHAHEEYWWPCLRFGRELKWPIDAAATTSPETPVGGDVDADEHAAWEKWRS